MKFKKDDFNNKKIIYKQKINILGLPIFAALLILFISILHIFIAYEPSKKDFNDGWHNLISILLFIMIIAGFLKLIGQTIPILKSIGGGAILCLLAPSFLFNFRFSFLSSTFSDFQNAFIKKITFFSSNQNIGFLEFFIASLVAGSLVNIKKEMINKVFKKFLPLVIISLTISAFIVGILGYFLHPIKGPQNIGGSHYNYFTDSIFYIFIPIASGGITCGIIPLATIFSQNNLINKEIFQTHILPALLIGGVFSVVLAGLIKKIFRKTKYDSPDGSIEKKSGFKLENQIQEKLIESPLKNTNIATGLILIFSSYVLSSINRTLILLFLPHLKNYIPPVIIFLVIICVIFKFFDFINLNYSKCIHQASQLMITNFTSAILVILGIGIKINIILQSFSNLTYIMSCLLCVLMTALISAFIGNKMGYYPVQSSIAAGLCTQSIGGVGNLAILEASDSLELMPYAQISTRLGGDIIVILASFLFPLFYTII